MNKAASNKNDKLYQGSTCNHIHWLYKLWKKSPCFRVDRKHYNKHFDYIINLCPKLRWNKTYARGWIKHDDKVWLI